MPSRLAESILALFAGRTRAAAIMGDLTEMAIGRSSLWFAAAYLRTFLSLTWRIVLALVAATVGRQIIFNSLPIYLRHTPASWRADSGPYLLLLHSSGPLLACLMSTLWFVLPFAAVRYGVHDRFVRLTFVVTLGSTFAFLFIPFASVLCALATIALACAALFSAAWRKPLEVLAWTTAASVLALGASSAIPLHFHPQTSMERLAAHYVPMLVFRSTLILTVLVCSRVYRLLLNRPTPA